MCNDQSNATAKQTALAGLASSQQHKLEAPIGDIKGQEAEYFSFMKRTDAFWKSVGGYFSNYHSNGIVGGVRDRDSRESCITISQDKFCEQHLTCPIDDMPF